VSAPSSDGFIVVLDDLQRVADQALPALGDVLRGQLGTLNTHEKLNGAGRLPGVDAYQRAYDVYTSDIAARQQRGCDVVYETAEAARQIAMLYRRADGQG
jgi:hypothetical protein